MVIVGVVNDDLLNSKEDYICQQCNCNTKKGFGLSKYISDRFPWANVYKKRSQPDTPGTLKILEHPEEPDKFFRVICLMGQWLPGKPMTYKNYYPTTFEDTYKNRKKWFKSCLKILDKNNYGKIAMPYLIGCGLAGGRWSDYKKMLEECKTQIVLYKI